MFNTTIYTGDCLLVKRDGLIGWLITRFTGGDRSHAMTAVDERYVKEAREAGWIVIRREHEQTLNDTQNEKRIWCVSADCDGLWASPLEQWIVEGYDICVRRIPNIYGWSQIVLPEGWKDRLGNLAVRVCGLWDIHIGIYLLI